MPELAHKSEDRNIGMPISTYAHIPAFVVFLGHIMPKSVLDVGIGNGKMGFIARDLLDVMLRSAYKEPDWRVKIDGIEIFPDYIRDHQKAIYDNIYIGDAFDLIDDLGKYDLIILGDVLEHFDKKQAMQFLDKCFAHTKHHIILNIPLGNKWTQSAIYENPHEEHLSFWSPEELEPLTENKYVVRFPDLGNYGCFLLTKEKYAQYKKTHQTIRDQADFLFASGQKQEAITYMKLALSEYPLERCSEFMLVDFMLTMEQMEEAITRLEGVHKIFDDDPSVRRYIDTLKMAHENVRA